MRKAAVIAFIVVLAGSLSLGGAVEAQSPPHVFVGEVLLDGTTVPDGTLIRAVLKGRPLPRAETTVQDGKFTLIVEQPEEEPAGEAVISFAVGDFLAQQSQPWELGELTLVTLTAFSALPALPVEIGSTLPETLVRGEEFLVSVRVNTGFYQATGGEISVNFNPQVFAANPEGVPPATGRTQRVAEGQGNFRVDWTYHSPISTIAWDGVLAQIPMRVRDSAPTGNASLSISVGLTGLGGQPFPLEPGQVSAEVSVVSTAADLNGDDLVDFADLAALASAWGTGQGEPGFRPAYDLDGDGSIWIGDLGILMQSYRAVSSY